jgi:predicted GNAT family N-acyltransferase
MRPADPSHSVLLRIESVEWSRSPGIIAAIRDQVFVKEQGVPVELELDGLDADCWHLVAWNEQKMPIGTARLHPQANPGVSEGKIGRMAVLKPWRGMGVGRALLRHLLGLAQARGMTKLSLAAQIAAVGFYEKEGFRMTGLPFDDAGIPHRLMILTVGARPSDTVL